MQLIPEKIKSLRTMMHSSRSSARGGNTGATIISLCNQKGGVGKTTTAVNLAFNMAALHGKRVLLMDLDPQGHVESSLTSIIPEGQKYRTLSELFSKKKPDFNEAIVQTELKGLRLTPGDKALAQSESLLSSMIGKEFILHEGLQSMNSLFDVILIDCPPNLGNLTLNALVASDSCIIPCEMSMLSLEGVSDIFDTIETLNSRFHRSLSILGILLTRVDTRNLKMNEAVYEQIESHVKSLRFHNEIAINTDLAKAQMQGKPVLTYAPSSKGSKNYQEFTIEVMDRLLKAQRLRTPARRNAEATLS